MTSSEDYSINYSSDIKLIYDKLLLIWGLFNFSSSKPLACSKVASSYLFSELDKLFYLLSKIEISFYSWLLYPYYQIK